MANSPLSIPAPRELNVRRSTGRKVKSGFDSLLVRQAEILAEETFHSMLILERRRAERSRKPFVLMLLDASAFAETGAANHLMSQVASVLLKCTRETDLIGWHENHAILGVIFTEISLEFKNPITEILHTKVVNALHDEVNPEIISNLVVTVHLFPESGDRGGAGVVADHRFYSDVQKRGAKKRLPLVVKRVIDIAGSALLLLIGSPLLSAIAVTIKLTSKGPVI